MDFDITIGSFRLKMVEAVKVKHSVEQLSDTAIISLPSMVEGKTIDVESKLHVGDVVVIKLGYDNNLKTEFKGYLKAINTDAGRLTLECEDAIYLFDKKVDDVELTRVSTSALLQKVASQIDPTIVVQTEFDFIWEKFVMYKATGRDILKKVQDETKANIWFDGLTLHVQPQYAQSSGKTVVFDFARNIESSNLKYRKKEDKKIEVEVILIDDKGEQSEYKAGSPGGKAIKKKVSGISPNQCKSVADNEYNMWCYDGFEGSFTGWLVPYVQPADAVLIRDADYPTKEGKYYVLGTEINFSKEGGKRTVSIGRRLR